MKYYGFYGGCKPQKKIVVLGVMGDILEVSTKVLSVQWKFKTVAWVKVDQKTNLTT